MNDIEILKALAQAVEDSTREVEVCVPSVYWKEAGGMAVTSLEFVCPYILRVQLEQIISNIECAKED